VARREKAWSGAYIIPSVGKETHPWYGKPKGSFVCEAVLGSLFTSRDHILRLCKGGIRSEVHAFLVRHNFFESFLAGQVVDDWTWCPILAHATDLFTWAPLGPGSRKGLNRLAGRPEKARLSQAQAVREMLALWGRLKQDLPWTESLTLMDIQNVCCECSKYLKVLRGEGQTKARYRPETAYTL
jgi:hypothetical protein